MLSISSFPQLLSSTHLCFVSVYLSILESYSAIFCFWLTHDVFYISPSFCLWLNDIPLYGFTVTLLFIHDGHLGCCEQYCYEYACTCICLNTDLSTLGIYLGMDLKGQMVVVYVTFWATTTLVFFFHLLTTFIIFLFLIRVVLVVVNWCFIEIFICISLVINSVEPLSMCLLSLYISFWEKCVFKFFAHF